MEETPSFPSLEFDKLLKEMRSKKLSQTDPKTIPDVPNPGKFTKVYVYKVIDGDTIKVVYECGNTVHKTNVRVNGVDTPETRSGSDLEKRAGKVVTRVVQDMIEKRDIFIQFLKKDKYGGRMVGDVYLPSDVIGGDENVTLCNYLVNNKLGHSYTGKTKKSEWTSKELDYIIGFI